MKMIQLSRGQSAKVDDEDLESLSKLKWCALFAVCIKGFYAVRRDGKKSVSMHRQIMNCPPGMIVDHINHDTLDNRRLNLRVVTRSQNSQNRRGAQAGNKTGIRGVSWNKAARKFTAQIYINKARKHLGSFSTARAASIAYQKANRANFGEFGGQ